MQPFAEFKLNFFPFSPYCEVAKVQNKCYDDLSPGWKLQTILHLHLVVTQAWIQRSVGQHALNPHNPIEICHYDFIPKQLDPASDRMETQYKGSKSCNDVLHPKFKTLKPGSFWKWMKRHS